MPESVSSSDLRLFVGRVEEFARYLDTGARRLAAGLSHDHLPRIASPDGWLRPIFLSLKADCDRSGETADEVFFVIAGVFEDVTEAASTYRHQGNLDPWVRCRDRVREQLDRLRSIMPLDPLARPVVAQAVSVQPAAARQLGDATGGKGEKVDRLLDSLPTNARSVIRLLYREKVVSMATRWTQATIAEELKLTDGKARRALEWLRKHELTQSHVGQDGGVWLSQIGVSVAERIAAGSSR